MEGKEMIESEKEFALPPLQSPSVGIAINGNRKSQYVVKWALNRFISEEKVVFKLIHVHDKITAVPTAMGNSIPLSQVRDDVAAAYKKEVEWQKNELLLPFKRMFTQKKVKVDVIVVESDDVAKAIAGEVAKCTINKLVIGASSNGFFTRKFKERNLSSRISECTPSYCTVYVVSRGKLLSIRPSKSEINGSTEDYSSDTNSSMNSTSSDSSSQLTDPGSAALYSHFRSPSLPMQRFHALSSVNQTLLYPRTTSNKSIHSSCKSLDIREEDVTCASPTDSEPDCSISQLSSCRNFPPDNQSWISDRASTSDASADFSSGHQVDIKFELEKLRTELRHVRGMYAMAQNETMDASRKLNNLNKCRLEEAIELKELMDKEEKAKELARQEKEKYEAAKREALSVRECVEREAWQRKEMETIALFEAKEREKLEGTLVDAAVQQYQNFTWEEIVSATLSFSENLTIGMGAYGTVYKGSFHHTTAAIKVLHPHEGPKPKQFQQELEILSKIRHPHLLLLIGACPDRGCLVYEYMENGSLEDRLLRKNYTPPVPWFERFRIAWEVASALVFLHNSKPKPIVHRDLKPANILLDHNLVSKIGDVGLSTMLHLDPSSISTIHKDTGLVGTLCYIDPEYQRTGIVSPKSDVYAFGMVILQLLTAKPAMALAYVMETAISEGRLMEILDTEAGEWPIEETKELASIGLSCVELQRKDRPDLRYQVLPALERLRGVANATRASASDVQSVPPSHFLCPILQDVMNDPCVAADGYTYDREAIERWLERSDKSPLSNLPLPNKNLISNYTLLSAIMEWKSRTR